MVTGDALLVIENDNWYTLAEVLEPDVGIISLDEYEHLAYLEPTTEADQRSKEAMLLANHFELLGAQYGKNSFHLFLDSESYNPQDLSQTSDGLPIYFTHSMPRKEDVLIYRNLEGREAGMSNMLARATFHVRAGPGTLDIDAQTSVGLLVLARSGIFACESPYFLHSEPGVVAALALKGIYPEVIYDAFRPFHSSKVQKKPGHLYIPLDMAELSALEINLFQMD